MSHNHKSLNNVLQLLLYYIQGHQMTMEQLKSWFNVSDRTIRNYHNTLKEYGMDIQLSGGRYSLKCEDNTSIERLLDRLGYLQDTYMGIEEGSETLWSDDNVIKPGLEEWDTNDLEWIYKMFILKDKNANIDLNQISVIEYKKLVKIINVLRNKKKLGDDIDLDISTN